MRIKGIKRVKPPKGKGKEYFYHRATGKRIDSPFGTAAFAAEVAALDARFASSAPRDGSLTALIVAYKQSPNFVRLRQRTKSDYNKVFDYLARIGDMPAHAMDSSAVYRIRDAAFKTRKRRFANYVVQVIRIVFGWAKPRKLVDENPATDIESLPRPKDMPRANRPWTDEEREVVLAEASIELRALIALGMFAGLREGDACSVGKSCFSGTIIECVAAKNNEPLWLPVHFRLRAILADAMRVRQEKQQIRSRRRKVVPLDPPTLVVTSKGHQWTEAGLRASFFKLVRRLRAENKVGPGLTFHGLRHTMGKLVIEAGGSKEDVKMILGDRSDAMGEFYSREFEKRGRVSNAMLKLEHDERAKMNRVKSDT